MKIQKLPPGDPKASPHAPKIAALTAASLLLLCLASLFYLLRPAGQEKGYAAEIFQDGALVMRILLDEEAEGEIFPIQGENGCVNEIEIRQGGIRVRFADCPDQICVRQGFLRDSRLPITCLPNRLVIRLQPLPDSPGAADEPDMVTH